MAKGRVGGRGQRGWIARFRIPLLLIGFLLIALGVILRRSMGIAAGRELQQLDARRAALVAQRLRLEAEVRAAASRSRLQPIAEQRLNMHVPSDSQVVIITRAPVPVSAPPHDAP
jgi:cell division protein FtsL